MTRILGEDETKKISKETSEKIVTILMKHFGNESNIGCPLCKSYTSKQKESDRLRFLGEIDDDDKKGHIKFYGGKLDSKFMPDYCMYNTEQPMLTKYNIDENEYDEYFGYDTPNLNFFTKSGLCVFAFNSTTHKVIAYQLAVDAHEFRRKDMHYSSTVSSVMEPLLRHSFQTYFASTPPKGLYAKLTKTAIHLAYLSNPEIHTSLLHYACINAKARGYKQVLAESSTWCTTEKMDENNFKYFSSTQLGYAVPLMHRTYTFWIRAL